MEADIAVQLHSDAKEAGLRYKAVIGDEDSSAIKHIKEKVNSDVEKYSDIGHIKRSISNKLEEMSKKHKSLTKTVRTAFLTNFTFAFYQNNSKTADEMKTALENLVPHMYGEHEKCGFHKSGSYRHKNLPYGKDLSDEELRSDLEALLKSFKTNSKKLLTTGHSRPNESLNGIAWSKAPKFRNYTLSESFDFRCAAAVCQFNVGKTYVDSVCKTAQFTPQKRTKLFNERQDRKRKYQKDYKNRKEFKKARKSLKMERSKKEIVYGVKEGLTYMTDCSLQNPDTIDTMCIPDDRANTKIDAEDILPVYLDLETTRLGHNAEIIQLAAFVDSSTVFNSYIMPTGSINESATAVTGFTIERKDGMRRMYQHGIPVYTVDKHTGLTSFIEWLSSISDKKKILIAHNGSRFDFPILFEQLESAKLVNNAKTAITGVCDSIHVLKTVIKNRESKKYSLGVLYEETFGETFDGHDALNDAKAIAKIFQNVQVSKTQIAALSVDTSSTFNNTRHNRNLKQAVDNFECSINNKNNKIVSHGMARKICKSRLTYEMLKLAHFRDREQGIRAILSEKVGKVLE
ncbi:uncharacterized protein LOC123565301 [Mercenaria mercenaria]|uniref:uncharacterized protein LOC123565301 n=1 Tax=Mercenaria mercenaria TaxID=6596 RepID=UPI00234E696A|nr:uncharacterized protein LOC123565301 [Mercenaria mercenaria]